MQLGQNIIAFDFFIIKEITGLIHKVDYFWLATIFLFEVEVTACIILILFGFGIGEGVSIISKIIISIIILKVLL